MQNSNLGLGVDQTAEMLDFAAILGNAVDSSLLDGKIGIADIGNFFSLIPAFKPAFEGVKQIPAEIADLTDAERAYLSDRLAAKLRLSNPAPEKLVEKGFDLSLRIAEFVAEIRSVKSGIVA